MEGANLRVGLEGGRKLKSPVECNKSAGRKVGIKDLKRKKECKGSLEED